MEKNFSQLGLTDKLIEGLSKSNIVSPTEIQEKMIPLALEGKNIIGQSETGTGKTLAYLLPIFQKNTPNAGVQTIILAPTHELASQIKTQVELLAKKSEIPLTYALIIGEVNIKRQIDKMKEKPNIIIGSSGRILELFEKKKINPKTITTLVIDEADRMLDKKNIDQVRKISKLLDKDKQTFLISASISKHNIELAEEFTTKPELVICEQKKTVPDTIIHSYYMVDPREKIETLRKLVNFLKPEKAIVFVQDSKIIERLTERTKYHGMKIGSLHGAQEKEDRKSVLDNFRKGTVEILFTTDIASRGLDIPNVTHVFNFDLTTDTKSYLHRCGRTGRLNNGTIQVGHAISLVTPDEKPVLNSISKELAINIELKTLSN